MLENQILRILPHRIRETISAEHLQYMFLQEIRLRMEKPLLLIYRGEERMPLVKSGRPYLVTKEDLKEALEYISNYSLYAYEQEMKQGFITIEGGHRVGMTGQAMIENGQVKNLKYISSINIRMSHEILGCADAVFPYIICNRKLCHTLIVSPPGCGKTTLLRDLIRQISNGNSWIPGMSVGVVDERSEIGGCYMGVAQNQLGIRTDVLDGCPKAEGMIMLIRTMSPEVIAVDEIGTVQDVHAIEYAMHCGCKMIATVHASSMEELRKKPLFDQMIAEGRFERYILLGSREHAGHIEGIFDERGSMLYQEGLREMHRASVE
ncbi:MAG: stage III sporulation protein AA [Dorea sp.]|nr:stage III sporulation protein AA [Dorea sp.]